MNLTLTIVHERKKKQGEKKILSEPKRMLSCENSSEMNTNPVSACLCHVKFHIFTETIH